MGPARNGWRRPPAWRRQRGTAWSRRRCTRRCWRRAGRPASWRRRSPRRSARGCALSWRASGAGARAWRSGAGRCHHLGRWLAAGLQWRRGSPTGPPISFAVPAAVAVSLLGNPRRRPGEPALGAGLDGQAAGAGCAERCGRGGVRGLPVRLHAFQPRVPPLAASQTSLPPLSRRRARAGGRRGAGAGGAAPPRRHHPAGCALRVPAAGPQRRRRPAARGRVRRRRRPLAVHSLGTAAAAGARRRGAGAGGGGAADAGGARQPAGRLERPGLVAEPAPSGPLCRCHQLWAGWPGSRGGRCGRHAVRRAWRRCSAWGLRKGCAAVLAVPQPIGGLLPWLQGTTDSAGPPTRCSLLASLSSCLRSWQLCLAGAWRLWRTGWQPESQLAQAPPCLLGGGHAVVASRPTACDLSHCTFDCTAFFHLRPLSDLRSDLRHTRLRLHTHAL